ncbi:putative transcription factor C2H2 family [Medicago truncatula]|uniref:C2H2-type zinc-finger protein, putative n=1 Tax=Medicago truncatula TaxID=3880 RepID=G7IVM3_MEDTR|nr:zinc finger protein ZAT4 [Medicago truncatula]AES68442.1 C2H2-type zinc-finger protein, putative [Medicago truncatula]RHN65361.1 putative transcription factor C2H2 family [Medicago truncatula]
MENNGRVCLICNRSFFNGKALGGHMKSHYAKLPIHSKTPIKNHVHEYSAELAKHPTHSISTSSPSIVNPRNNSTYNPQSLKGKFSCTLSNFGRNSGFQSYRTNPTGKRSKRKPRQFHMAEDREENTQFNMAEEKEENTQFNMDEEKEDNTQLQSVYSDLDIEAAETLGVILKKEWKQIEDKYYTEKKKASENGNTVFECDICHEVFQSGKDLFGHEKIQNKSDNLAGEIGRSGNINNVVNEKVHKCEYCFEIFESGELLEEHTKVHLYNYYDSDP